MRRLNYQKDEQQSCVHNSGALTHRSMNQRKPLQISSKVKTNLIP